MGKKNVVWNDYISQNERFADFFNGVVFAGEDVVRPDALSAVDTKIWRRKREKDSYHEYIRDNVKMWRHETQSYILSLEPEDSPHFALPVKYMNYESIQYDRQYRRIQKKHQQRRDLRSPEYLSGFSEHDSLMPVITIGIYLGREEWSGFTTLTKMIGIGRYQEKVSDRLLPLTNDFHVNLFDIHQLETSEIFRTDLRDVLGFLKRQNDKEELRRYVEGRQIFRHLQEDAYDVLSVYIGNGKLEIRKEEYGTKEGFDMCLAIQELIEDGRAEGRTEGIAAVNELMRCLFDEGKTDELFRSLQDFAYQKELMKAYGIRDGWTEEKG